MYKINYDSPTGKPCSIQKGNMSIPIEPRNMDFVDFLKCNKQQKTPLNYEKSIEVEPPEPVETMKEKIERIVDAKLAATVTK